MEEKNYFHYKPVAWHKLKVGLGNTETLYSLENALKPSPSPSLYNSCLRFKEPTSSPRMSGIQQLFQNAFKPEGSINNSYSFSEKKSKIITMKSGNIQLPSSVISSLLTLNSVRNFDSSILFQILH